MTEQTLLETYKGYSIFTFYDDFAESPRAWNNLGELHFMRHNEYSFCDNNMDQEYKHAEDLEEAISAHRKEGAVILPVYMYEHGGITFSTGGFSCPWDSGQIGFIVATADAIRKNYNVKRITAQTRAKVEDVLRDEVEIFAAYAEGDVHGYAIQSPEGETIETLHGFYGYDHEKSGLLAKARSTVNYAVADEYREACPLFTAFNIPMPRTDVSITQHETG